MNQIRNVISKITSKLAYISMAITFALMIITTVDVVMRKVSTSSILGSYEMTEMGMVFLLAIAVPYLQVSKGHVRVDMFVEMFPRRFQYVLDGLTLLASGGVISFMVYALFKQAGDYVISGAMTSVIHIPYAPFVYSMVVGYFLYAVLLLIDSIICFIKAVRNDPSADLKVVC